MKPAIAFASGRQYDADVPNKGTPELCSAEASDLLGFVALLCWQSCLLLALCLEFIECDLYAGLHVVSCFAIATFLIWRSSVSVNSTVLLQIVAWAACAGPFGAFVAAALLLPPTTTHSMRPSESDTGRWPSDRSEDKRVESLHQALLDSRIRLACDCQIRPLMDVIAEGSQSEKLEALAALYRRYGSDLSPVLKRALHDRDTPVRVLAATVAAKLHATFSRNIGAREVEAEATPQFARNWRELADARLSYAASGLLEAPRARAEIELGVRDLLRAIEIDPEDRDTASRLDEAYRRLASVGAINARPSDYRSDDDPSRESR